MESVEKRKVLTPAQKQRLAFQQQYLCAICAVLLPSTWQVDHKIPLHQGGSNEWHNLQILCPLCHAEKTQVEAIEREMLKRESPKSVISTSPYFQVQAYVSDRPLPKYILKRCRAPHISVNYIDI